MSNPFFESFFNSLPSESEAMIDLSNNIIEQLQSIDSPASIGIVEPVAELQHIEPSHFVQRGTWCSHHNLDEIYTDYLKTI